MECSAQTNKVENLKRRKHKKRAIKWKREYVPLVEMLTVPKLIIIIIIDEKQEKCQEKSFSVGFHIHFIHCSTKIKSHSGMKRLLSSNQYFKTQGSVFLNYCYYKHFFSFCLQFLLTHNANWFVWTKK